MCFVSMLVPRIHIPMRIYLARSSAHGHSARFPSPVPVPTRNVRMPPSVFLLCLSRGAVDVCNKFSYLVYRHARPCDPFPMHACTAAKCPGMCPC